MLARFTRIPKAARALLHFFLIHDGWASLCYTSFVLHYKSRILVEGIAEKGSAICYRAHPGDPWASNLATAPMVSD